MKVIGRFFAILILLGMIFNTTNVFAKKHKHHRKVVIKSSHATKKTIKSKRHRSSRRARTGRVYQPSSAPIYGNSALIAEITRAVRSVSPNVRVGVKIKSMQTGDVLYSLNENSQFTPASIMKILTAETALLYLGGNYKFPTKLVTDGSLGGNGAVNGNLYLVHSGDPSLTYNDIREMMNSLKSKPVSSVQGNVFIDITAYDQRNTGAGWSVEDTRYCFGAPINASIINHNCISFLILPAKSPGQLASVVPSRNNFIGLVNNTVMTRSSFTHPCSLQFNQDGYNTVSVSGCLHKGQRRGATVVIPNMLQYNRALMQTLLRQNGIAVSGRIEARPAPANITTLALHESKPLHHLVTDMLKKSDNVIAGSLFKKLGELYTEQPGSWVTGSTAVKKLLNQHAGINTAQMNLIDGSGLSRYNLITPAQMMQLLDFAFHDEKTNYEFMSALPIAGVDGTLKHRLGNVAWKVHAKTGTIAGVVSLAGYTINKDKEPIAFVIILNGKKGEMWRYRAMEDKIVTALTNYSRSG